MKIFLIQNDGKRRSVYFFRYYFGPYQNEYQKAPLTPILQKKSSSQERFPNNNYDSIPTTPFYQNNENALSFSAEKQ